MLVSSELRCCNFFSAPGTLPLRLLPNFFSKSSYSLPWWSCWVIFWPRRNYTQARWPGRACCDRKALRKKYNLQEYSASTWNIFWYPKTCIIRVISSSLVLIVEHGGPNKGIQNAYFGKLYPRYIELKLFCH